MIIASRRENEYVFYHYDLRGSVTTIVKAEEGNIILEEGYEYDAFGETTAKKEDFFNEIKFTGAVQESSTGLYYMNARHYDPSTGRFLQQDTYAGSIWEPMT